MAHKLHKNLATIQENTCVLKVYSLEILYETTLVTRYYFEIDSLDGTLNFHCGINEKFKDFRECLNEGLAELAFYTSLNIIEQD